jgi:hypothetical protein
MEVRAVSSYADAPPRTAAARTWTADEIRALGATTDVPTAGSIFGVCKTQSFEYVKEGRFPVPVIPVGGKPGRPRRLVVPVAPILELLGLSEPGEAPNREKLAAVTA